MRLGEGVETLGLHSRWSLQMADKVVRKATTRQDGFKGPVDLKAEAICWVAVEFRVSGRVKKMFNTELPKMGFFHDDQLAALVTAGDDCVLLIPQLCDCLQ